MSPLFRADAIRSAPPCTNTKLALRSGIDLSPGADPEPPRPAGWRPRELGLSTTLVAASGLVLGLGLLFVGAGGPRWVGAKDKRP